MKFGELNEAINNNKIFNILQISISRAIPFSNTITDCPRKALENKNLLYDVYLQT